MKTTYEMLKTKGGSFLAGNGATEEAIVEAETSLNTKFAQDYRCCLLNCGTFFYEGHEFTGITKTQRISLVDVTRQQRSQNLNIPEGWYVIEEANMDGIIVWQTPDGKIYLTQYDSAPCFAAENLAAFLRLDEA